MSEPPPALLPIMRSRAQLALLTHLYLGHPNEYTTGELREALNVPQQTLNRELLRLIAAGLVREKRLGRLRVVTANEDTPIFTDLRNLLLKTSGPEPLLRTEIGSLADVHEAFIFGSFAARSGSEIGPMPRDVDVAVIGVVQPDRVYEVAQRVSEVTQREVNAVVISPEEWSTSRRGFIRTLREGPRVTLVGPPA